MVMASLFCEQHFLREVDNLVCVDVDMKFCNNVGMELLSPLFGTLYPSFYWVACEDFSYQHWPQSQATSLGTRVMFTTWGPFLGRLVVEVHRLTLACHQAMGVDLANGIEVEWCDESHLNRYLLDRKPSKMLSLEDLWDPWRLGCPPHPLHEEAEIPTMPRNHQDIQES
ncbi:unnamed protein product [Gulo gulo]|uniref:Uncharacterized protein n=1 Tax=Gulo gulo TaxID=48420 RepID=A0A9X9PVG2_GULGU|nr:unnamed protein product [Gulo gulo]